MTEVLQANIFFLIASIGVVVFIIMISIAVYQVIRILRAIRLLVERVESGSESLIEDVSQLKSYVVGGGLLSRVIGFFIGMHSTQSRKAGKEVSDN